MLDDRNRRGRAAASRRTPEASGDQQHHFGRRPTCRPRDRPCGAGKRPPSSGSRVEDVISADSGMATKGSIPENRQAEERIGADADEALLADGDDVGIAGQQVPHQRERQHVKNSVSSDSWLGSNSQGPAKAGQRHDDRGRAARPQDFRNGFGGHAVSTLRETGPSDAGRERQGTPDVRQRLPRGVELAAEILRHCRCRMPPPTCPTGCRDLRGPRPRRR